MLNQKSIIGKSRNGQKSKTVQIKPAKYIEMVVAALRSLQDRKGSIPKNIVGYIANTYDIASDRKTISSGVYRALKQGLSDETLIKNCYGHYILNGKAKRRTVPGKKRRKKRKGKKKGKKRRGKKGKKKRGKKKKRAKRRRKRRKSSKSKPPRRRFDSDEGESRRRRRGRSRMKDLNPFQQ